MTDKKTVLDLNIDFPWRDIQPVYTLAGTYDKTNGKFSQVFGNVAIVDCAYFFYDLLDAATELVGDMPASREKLKYELLIAAVNVELEKTGITTCEFPFEIDGVLNNQASYYIDKYREIEYNID